MRSPRLKISAYSRALGDTEDMEVSPNLFTDLVKLSALGTAIAAKPSVVGRFKGLATAHALKPPGMASSLIAVNPRRSIASAINTYKA